MNTATLQLVLEAKDLVTPALERLRAEARGTGREGGRAALGLEGLNRAGKGLDPTAGSMERLRTALKDLGRDLPDAALRTSRAFGQLRQHALEPGLRSMEALRNGASRLRQALRETLEETPGSAPASSTNGTNGIGGTGGLPRRFAGGGVAFNRLAHPLITKGSGTADDVPALLMRGEFVLRKDAVRKYGLDFLQSLNSMRLPAASFQAVPKLATGGVVLPPQFVNLVPRFAGGGVIGPWGQPSSATTMLEYYGARSYATLMQSAAQQIERAATALNLPLIQQSPAQYLSQAIGVATETIEVFKQTPYTTQQASTVGAAAETATETLERKKTALNAEYTQRINLEKSQGNTALAALLEQQRIELESIITELQLLLEELAADYRDTVEQAALDAESELESLAEQYQEEKAETEEALENLGMSRDYTAVSMRKSIARKVQNLNRSYLLKGKKIQRGAGSQIKTASRSFDREERKAYKEIISAEGTATEQMGRLELRETYNDYLERIRDLEIELAVALQELEDDYGSLSITGFKHWLASGGLVGGAAGTMGSRPMAFARGGFVPRYSWARADSDSVPALLMPGEFVLRKDATQAIGRATLERLNSLDSSISRNLAPVLRFAQGGEVPGTAPAGGLTAALQPVAPSTDDWGTLNIQIGGAAHQVLSERQVARSLRKHLSKLARSAS